MALDFPAAGNALWAIFDATGIRPEYLIPVLAYESGLRPDLPNLQGYPYYGINQLAGSALKAEGIDPADYLTWSASEQLAGPVKKYFEAVIAAEGPVASGIRLYQGEFYPVSLKKNLGLDDAIVSSPSDAYTANKGFDTAGKGYITPRDLGHAITGQLALPYVRDAITKTYQLRPTETERDPVYGTDFGGAMASDKVWSDQKPTDGTFTFEPGQRYAVLASVDKGYSLADVEKEATGKGFTITYAWEQGQASRATYAIDNWLQGLPPDNTGGQRWVYAEGNFTGDSAWTVNQDPSFVQRLVIGSAYHISHVFLAVDAPASSTTTTTPTTDQPPLPETSTTAPASSSAMPGAVFWTAGAICVALVAAAWGVEVIGPRIFAKAV